MKVVILVPQFPPKALGGTEISTYSMAKYLAHRGHEVNVITSLDKGLPQRSCEFGFYIHRIRLYRIRFVGIILFWLRILLTIKTINPDIIHVQGITLIGTLAVITNILFKKPYIVYARGSDIYLPWKYKKIMIKHIFNRAAAIVTLTYDLKRTVKEMYGKDALVIPNGVDFDKYINLKDRDLVRSKMGISTASNVLLFVGTLKPIKGVRYLIKAMNTVHQSNEDIKLLIVGDGEEKEYLEHLTKKLNLNEVISFIGSVPNVKVPDYMYSADILVQPSISEGFPVVILEAMALGLPIITTNVTGLPEIVGNLRNGLLVEPRDANDIADKVMLMINDNELQKAFSRNNKEDIKRYGWQEIVKEIELLYSSSLKT